MKSESGYREASRVAQAVFLLAMGLLAFQLVSTRLFSVIIWNHFAFLAISVSLFGFGVAGVVVYLLPKVFTRQRALDQIRFAALLLPFVIAAAVTTLCSLPIRMDFSQNMFTYLWVIFLTTSLPFMVGGTAITLALTHWPKHVNRVYAYDLVGSALGCLVVIGVLDVLDGPTAALAVGLLPALAAWRLRPTRGVVVLTALIVTGVAVNAHSHPIRVRVARSAVAQPIFEAWNAFSRVTVEHTPRWRGWWVGPRSPEPPVAVLGIRIDSDAYTPVMRFDGDFQKVQIVLADITALAYQIAPEADRVLVIGAGGGKDVLAALASGARHVRAVELNSIIARDIVSDRFREFSGDLYRHPRVELVVGEGRTVLRHDTSRYDILQLSMVDTSAASTAGAYALTENSLYTLEATREYLEHLTPDGIFTATWANFTNLKGGNRLVGQIAAALRLEGHANVTKRIAVVGAGSERSGMPLVTVLVRPAGFTEAQIAGLRREILRRGLRPVYLPGDSPHGVRPGSDDDTIRTLIQGRDLEAFYDAYPLDLRPVTDDRPFFFYQNRFRDALGALTRWSEGVFYGNGMLILVKLVVISAFAVLAFVALPMLIGRRKALDELRGSARFLLYFLCLGIGFIVLEIALLQMFGYYLGHPLLGLGVGLAALLLFTGLGSASGGRWSREQVPARLRVALLGVIGLGVLYFWLLPPLTQATIGWPVLGRCATVAVVVAPLGLLLGVPFPAGLRLLQPRTALVPWMWAINSGATVLGASLATLAVMHLGFARTILLGVAVYAVALATIGGASTHSRTDAASDPMAEA